MSLARWSLRALILMHLGQCHDPLVWAKVTVLWRVMQFKRLQGAGEGQKYYERREDSAEIQMGLANLPHHSGLGFPSRPRHLFRTTCDSGWAVLVMAACEERRAHPLNADGSDTRRNNWPNTSNYLSTVITTNGPGW